jgi:hypothetical protein
MKLRAKRMGCTGKLSQWLMTRKMASTPEGVAAIIQGSRLSTRCIMTISIQHDSKKKEERNMALAKKKRKKKRLKKALSTEALARAYFGRG